MSSEELGSRGLSKKGFQFGEFEFFPTHSTTVKQYKQAGIISKRNYGDYEKRKPDGLLVNRGGANRKLLQF